MLEKIFENVESSSERNNINDMLKRLYNSDMTVSDGIHNYNIDRMHGFRLGEKKKELLTHLVFSVREKIMDPEYLDIDDSKKIRAWNVKSPDGGDWTCVWVKTQDEWNKIIEYFCERWKVSTAYGTFMGGMCKFDGADIYMFQKYINKYVIDDPESNWDGCEGSDTFLRIEKFENERKRYTEYLRCIEENEKEAWEYYTD